MDEIKGKNFSFTGRLITSVTPYHIGDSDFCELINFCYTPTGIKTIKGMQFERDISQQDVTVISALYFNNELCYQTYPCGDNYTEIFVNFGSKRRVIAKKYSSSTQYSAGDIAIVLPHSGFYLECESGGTTGETPPDFDNYIFDSQIPDGTVTWIKREGNLTGKFVLAPDNTVVYTNGYHNLIYGGDTFRVSKMINIVSGETTGPELVQNGDFSSSSYWSWGTGWNHDAQNGEADHTPGNTQPLSQSIPISANKTYMLKFTVRNLTSGTITPQLGGVTETPVSSNGTFTFYFYTINTSSLSFIPSSDFDGSIDDVSVKNIPTGEENVDITDLLSDAQKPVVLKISDDRSLKIDIGSPLKIRGVNIHIHSPNTLSTCTLSVARYTHTFWENAFSVVDGTNKLFNSGTVSFSFSDDSLETKEASDIVSYLHGHYLYWYRITLTPTSGTLPSTISIYHVTLRTVIQNIPNIWDESKYTPALFLIQTGTDAYSDLTIPVSKRENSFTYITSWEVTPGTAARVGNYSTYYICSFFPLTGFRVFFPVLTNTSTVYSNTNNVTLSVSYWNGTSWVEIPGLRDDTRDVTSGITHARNGTISWVSVVDYEQKKRMVSEVYLYCYRISVNGTFSSNTYIDYIEVIPALKPPSKFITCCVWNNRLVLAGKYIGKQKNEMVISAPNSPYIWEGKQTIQTFVGPNTPITNITSLFTRYGNDVVQSMVVFKSDSMYMITGTSQEDIKIYQVSSSIGTSHPSTVQTCDLGIRITEGVNRSVVIFGFNSKVYLFDNATVVTISDDIRMEFSNYTFGFYDPVHSWYHICTQSREYVFDLTHKKWFEISRPEKLTAMVYSSGTVYGFVPRKMYRLNTGNRFGDSYYTCTAKTGIKPLEPSYNLLTSVRRLRVASTASSTGKLSVSITTDRQNYTTGQMDLLFPVHYPVNANITGIVYQIAYEASGDSDIELINLSLLYRPYRIEI